MQGQLLAENPATKIRLLGVNAAGHEAGNASMTKGKRLPWLQDTTSDNVWGSWAVTNRDLFILDAANVKRDVYNLTSNDLADPVNFDELKARLKIVAGEP